MSYVDVKKELNYINMETAYQRNETSVEAHIKFIKSIGGLKDVEITPELKEKTAEDLERFWRETPIERIAQD